MVSYAAQMLNELMGSDRNCMPDEKRRELRYDDSEVCKYSLCGFCPYDLFTNTRADLGVCPKLHDDDLVGKYQKSTRFERLGYEEDFVRYLQSLLSDVDKRIRKGHARLALNSQTGSMIGGPHVAREEKVQMLTDKINELIEQAEHLGCEGKVEEAQGVMKLCEQLQEERTHLQALGQRQDQGTSKDMEVCEICGALLVVGDAQQRIDEHIMGKQHMGYARIRAYIEGRKNKQKEEEDARAERLQKEREDREKEREVERQTRRDKEKEKEREREKERDRRRKRSRSRDSRRHRSRSHSRDRHRRSRDRDRKKRSRSRSRDRRSSRDRERRRSRSRSRGSHSKRSRDRDDDSREADHRDSRDPGEDQRHTSPDSREALE